MLNSYLFFKNPFLRSDIISERLYVFGTAVLTALQLANEDDKFTAIITVLTQSLNALQNELSNVDANLTDQKTETKTVGEFIYEFYTYMSDSEPFIAKALGGRNSAGFMAFYPFKQSEYSNATKAVMQKLTDRVARAAKKYGGKLDAEMAEKLASFSPVFKEQYAAQQSQINTVKTDRKDRNTAVLQLQIALTQALFTVGAAYPGDVETCNTFFPFQLLFSQGRKHTFTAEGKLAKETGVTVLNQLLTKNVEITVANKGKAANFAFWLAATPDGAMPEDAMIIMVGSYPMQLKAGNMIGYDKNSFYRIKNLSDVNECEYEVTFSGGKNKIGNSEVAVAEEAMEVVTA